MTSHMASSRKAVHADRFESRGSRLSHLALAMQARRPAAQARTSRLSVRPSAHDRILAAASKLFREVGIQATSIDLLSAAAGVSKSTFYRQFRTKDDLVVAWLRDSRTRWFDGVLARLEARSSDPAERIGFFFEGVAEWVDTEGYGGCPYLNVGIEMKDMTLVAQLVTQSVIQEVEDYLQGLIAAAGYRDSRRLAQEVQTLTAGAITLAVARRSSATVLTARDAAQKLLAAAARD